MKNFYAKRNDILLLFIYKTWSSSFFCAFFFTFMENHFLNNPRTWDLFSNPSWFFSEWVLQRKIRRVVFWSDLLRSVHQRTNSLRGDSQQRPSQSTQMGIPPSADSFLPFVRLQHLQKLLGAEAGGPVQLQTSGGGF